MPEGLSTDAIVSLEGEHASKSDGATPPAFSTTWQAKQTSSPSAFANSCTANILWKIAPTLVIKNGEPELVIDSGGSNRIRTAILPVRCNVLDFQIPLNRIKL